MQSCEVPRTIQIQRRLAYRRRMIRAEHDHRFAVVDEKAHERVVAAHSRDGLSTALLVERFKLSAQTLRRILADAGVEMRKGARCADWPREPVLFSDRCGFTDTVRARADALISGSGARNN
jgi:hypothetical protein